MTIKIGLITLNGYYNYGNRLQNYALHVFLKRLSKNIVVSNIWHMNSNYKVDDNKQIVNLKNIVRYLINRYGYREYIDKYINTNLYMYDCIREYNIKKFSDRYVHTVFDYQVKPDLNDRYDYFIVGSDQVWNPFWGDLKSGFLQFADQQKRIAYAVSFGVNKIPEDKVEVFRSGISNMRYISVREQAGADIVNSLIGKDIPVLLDPTLLLNKEDYLEIMQSPAWYKGTKYILVYFLGEMSEPVQEKLLKIAAENDLEIIDIMDKTNIDYYCTSPEEFLFLINNCSLMCTDSFHGAVFSIIMRVPFWVCSRQTTQEESMDSRIETLLQMLNLEKQRVCDTSSCLMDNHFEVDYSCVDTVLSTKRMEAKKFLCTALNISNEDN